MPGWGIGRGSAQSAAHAPRSAGPASGPVSGASGDFGPTLAAEYLREEDGLEVDQETLRRWLLAEGVRTVGRRRQRHRQWRERKSCFGEMLQVDGSHHDWFEGRGPPCVLMVCVDDATNRLRARFFEEETTHASYDTFEDWVRRHRLPRSVYVDRDSIYRGEGTSRELPARPARVQAGGRAVGRTQRVKPAAEHPWRRFGIAAGKRFWRGRVWGPPYPTGPRSRRRGPDQGFAGLGSSTLWETGPPKAPPHESGDIFS